MKYADLRDFITQLEAQGELKRIRTEVDPCLEVTEICDRTSPYWATSSAPRGGWPWAWARSR